jgi:hypothetical protein
VRVQQSAALWRALATLPKLEWVDLGVSDHPYGINGWSFFVWLATLTQIR